MKTIGYFCCVTIRCHWDFCRMKVKSHFFPHFNPFWALFTPALQRFFLRKNRPSQIVTLVYPAEYIINFYWHISLCVFCNPPLCVGNKMSDTHCMQTVTFPWCVCLIHNTACWGECITSVPGEKKLKQQKSQKSDWMTLLETPNDTSRCTLHIKEPGYRDGSSVSAGIFHLLQFNRVIAIYFRWRHIYVLLWGSDSNLTADYSSLYPSFLNVRKKKRIRVAVFGVTILTTEV